METVRDFLSLPGPCWALPSLGLSPKLCDLTLNQVSEPPSPSLYFIIIIIIHILVLEIKFVLEVYLSLVVPSPVHSGDLRECGGR